MWRGEKLIIWVLLFILTFHLYLTQAPNATCARATPSLEEKKKETKREEKKKIDSEKTKIEIV